jgi:RNA polymerase sigma-70 factor, ECF subfamily
VTLLRRRQTLPGLLARSRSSPRVFAEFYEEMAPSVHAFFRRETQDEQRALDLTAATFAAAFEKRTDFRGEDESQAAAWMWKIAHSSLARSRRSTAFEVAAIRRLGLERPIATDEELLEIERMGVEEDIHEHLDAALGRLPSDQQEVIRLRYSNELSYSEIASELGVSPDVARSRTSRALRALRSNHHMRDIVALRRT